ncbi:MAG TPA: 4-hydroxyphenylacetate 3-hydroxylase N-terminal domain-containing protein [Casimicrobiaceae bacterium]|nr:4-hydroxyphenylacetate 3-hydroxylase N-terminal domain-containing protein [Casimicrobiaceae bacterium]
MLMSAAEYRDSLRRCAPVVYVDGRRVESVADEPALAPGVNAIALTYDLALRESTRELMRAQDPRNGSFVNRMLAIPRSSADLVNKLEAVRLVCQETGCAQRYLAGDGLAALHRGTRVIDAECGTDYHARLIAYIDHVYENDLTLGIAMTDAKGDRSLRPAQQPVSDTYVHIVERRADGIVISGTKAIVTSAPYVHELLVLPCRHMRAEDAAFAVCCAVPIDAPGLTIVARPAGRPGEAAAKFSSKYGQSTGVCLFDRVFVPWERVFAAGETGPAVEILYDYTAHHRHTCIAARAGFGDLLIGAGALVTEANGLDLDRAEGARNAMVELIKIVEGFYACGVAASVYAQADDAGVMRPDAVFANIGKLLLATQIYDMHRLAHEVSGGMIVALPGPDEDHNPATAGRLSEVLTARSDIPYEKRIEIARLLEDLTASYQAGWYSLISLHGGGSPEAMKMEIYRNYPIGNRVDLVERLLERGILADETRKITRNRQPGRCCATGCLAPDVPQMVALPTPSRTTRPPAAAAPPAPLAAD